MPMFEPPRSADREPAEGRGFLLVVEGIDGTGKSTLVAALAAALRRRGRAVLETFEPTNGPNGRRIRQLAASGRDGVTPEEETELFIADRREHVANEIQPALAEGRWVLMDRYYYSTMAYQGARGMDAAEIERRHRAFAPEPDLLVVLELSVGEALARITRKRGSAPDHFEGEKYLEAVAANFRRIRHPRLMRLDARLPTKTLVQAVLDRLDEAPS
ncbi:MAG: dTMP kinase [bacterium]|nr:dTMP kinase [bacterium]